MCTSPCTIVLGKRFGGKKKFTVKRDISQLSVCSSTVVHSVYKLSKIAQKGRSGHPAVTTPCAPPAIASQALNINEQSIYIIYKMLSKPTPWQFSSILISSPDKSSGRSKQAPGPRIPAACVKRAQKDWTAKRQRRQIDGRGSWAIFRQQVHACFATNRVLRQTNLYIYFTNYFLTLFLVSGLLFGNQIQGVEEENAWNWLRLCKTCLFSHKTWWARLFGHKLSGRLGHLTVKCHLRLPFLQVKSSSHSGLESSVLKRRPKFCLKL